MDTISKSYNINLANYFASRPLYLDETAQKKPNIRRAVELVYQQRSAEAWEDAEDTLFDCQFALAKCAAGKALDLNGDYKALLKEAPNGLLPRRETLLLISDALDLSMHVVNSDFLQFSSQLVGRLLSNKDKHEIFQFIQEVSKAAPKPWLRPLQPCFVPPGGALLRTLVGHTDAVCSVAVLPDGNYIVSRSWNQTIKMWDLVSGTELPNFLVGSNENVQSMALTSDGQCLLTSDGNHYKVKVWNLESGKLTKTFNGPKIEAAAARYGISGYLDMTLKVWDIETGEELYKLSGHKGYIRTVALTSDGLRAISGSDDNTLKVWDILTGKEIYTLTGHKEQVSAVAITKDGTYAVSGSSDKTLKVWNIKTGKELLTLSGHNDKVTAVALSPDGKRAVSGSEDKTIKVWDIKKGVGLSTFTGHTSTILSLAVTSDGQSVVSGSHDKTIKVWNLWRNGESHVEIVHTSNVYAVAITPDKKHIISGSGSRYEPGAKKKWDLLTGEYFCDLDSGFDTFLELGYLDGICPVAVAPSGKRAVVHKICPELYGMFEKQEPNDFMLGVYDSQKWVQIGTLVGHKGPVNAVAITADGRRAVSGSRDETLKVWSLKTEVSAMQVWWWIKKIFGKQELYSLSGHKARVTSVAVTPDGRYVVSGSWDQTVKVWNIRKGREKQTLIGHKGYVTAVAVTQDGLRIVSCSLDQTLKVWDLETGTLFLTFHFEGNPTCCVCGPLNRIIVGDDRGQVYKLVLEE